jgi:hypothetical protein
MPENKLEAERDEEKPQRKRRLTLMESYGAFSDDRLREVTAKIRDLTSTKPTQDTRSGNLENPLGESIGDPSFDRIGDSIGVPIVDSIGTPIQTPMEAPIHSSDVAPAASPHEISNDSPLHKLGRSSLPSPFHSPIEPADDSPTGSPNVSPEGLSKRGPILLTENQAILYFCLQKINGVVTSLSRIARESRISEHTLKSCLKKLRQEGLIIYGGRRNCGGRIGFTAKTIERRIILRGDKGRLSRKLQQINYQALSFTEPLDETVDAAVEAPRLDHPMDHLLDNQLDHPVEDPMTHLVDHTTPRSLCSSSYNMKEQLLQGVVLEEAFQDLNSRSLMPFLEQFNSTEELQNFLDMANACITAAKEGHGKPIQNPNGFLIACLRAGYINPPEGYKSRKVRAQEKRNQQLEEELATLRQLKEREKQLRFELFQASLTDEDQERLEREARQKVNPNLGLSATRQVEVYKEDILKQWFEQRETP